MIDSVKVSLQQLRAFYDGRTRSLQRWFVAILATLLVGPVAYWMFLKINGPIESPKEVQAIAPIDVPGQIQTAPTSPVVPGHDPGEEAFPEVSFNRLGTVPEIDVVRTRAAASDALAEEAARKRAKRDAQAAVAMSRVREVRAAFESVKSLVQKLETEQARWEADYESLWEDDRGKQLVQNEPLAKEVIQILQEERPSQTDVQNRGVVLSDLESVLTNASNSPLTHVEAAEALLPQIQKIRAEVDQTASRFQVDSRTIDRKVTQSASTPVGTETLREFQRKQEELLMKKSRDKIAAATEGLLDSETQQQIDDIVDQGIIDAARRQLEREFKQEYPQIQARLIAFTSDGMELRGSSSGPGPVSFALMKGRGALERTPEGRQKIADVVGDSRRESGGLMKFHGGQSDQQARDFDQVQQFLSKYGLLMVERGLLAP